MRRPTAQPRDLLERLLTRNQLPFWEARAVDLRDGGYRINHDGRGRWRGVADKYLVPQARTLWFFSRVARSPYGNESHAIAAKHGYLFMRDRMWDAQCGGFFWRTGSSGRHVVQSGKHVYGQAFALYALSEYALSSGDATAVDLSRQLFAVLDERAYDREYGGYREFFARDWSEAEVDRGYLAHSPTVKTLNTHLHLLEAIARYLDLTDDGTAKQRLHELRSIMSEKIVRQDANIGASARERHRRDWSPYTEPDDLRVSFGHDVETAWLLMHTNRALGLPESSLLELARAILKNALAFGFDAANGGFYESGLFGAPADRRAKLWWVQAEGMLAALRMYRLTAEVAYADCFAQTLAWIVNRQADWKYGEWHERVDERGRPSGVKAGPWKAPYHGGRAVMDCLELLPTSNLPPS